jgi:dipeptidyl aminopeptidase/acylaminoacyl peptidase
MTCTLTPRSVRRLAAWTLVVGLPLASGVRPAAQTAEPAKPNYELAARWTSQKVGKIVFDTSVTPHWAETSDRFWYSYETSAGRRFMLVDPVRRAKAPIFDNARMAAMLTGITRIPYDAQHLPIRTLKWVRQDAAVQFDIEVPKDADIATKKPVLTDQAGNGSGSGNGAQQTGQQGQQGQTQQRGGQGQGQQAAEDKEEESKTKRLFFEYDLATGRLQLLEDFVEPPKKPRWASVSPDQKTVAFARGHNLFMVDAANYALAQKNPGDKTVVETQVTTDGEEHYSFARRLNDEDRRELKKDQKGDTHKDGPRVPPITINWSQDSKKFAVIRQDQRKVADLWVINSLANPRPTLETYRYAMPGEVNVAQSEILVFDRDTKQRVQAKAERFKDQLLAISNGPIPDRDREQERTEPRWVSATSDKLYFVRTSRDMRRVDVAVADTATGEVKTLIEERLNTYIETKPLRLVNGGQELVHWSERDGWGHYYLYDGNGTLKNQITSGEFSCNAIEGIDEKTRTLYFTATGREAGEDPYFLHLYRVGLDGSGLKILNPGVSTHAVAMADSSRYFVSTSSTVDSSPHSVLYDSAGTLLHDLETTDVSALVEAGFRFPEPFKVKADDGVTDLFGVMYKPFDFDPTKKYPIIAFVYPGPQTESVTKAFSPRSANVALAQLGFLVIEVGNRGGHPQRSKWYHNYGYGNLRDYGLADKKAAIEQLARRHAFIDIDRVGIYGHSGGGFMSTAAMLVYPDFFKVAVSSSGNHDNNVYNRNWSEKHHGVREVVDKDGNVKFEYDIEKNSEIAKNLKGRLLLVTGDMDDNVHMAGTLRVADALIKANKRFDFFMFPGKRHGYADAQDYFFWLRADYFARHLLGRSAESVDIVELNRDKEQVGNKGRP